MPSRHVQEMYLFFSKEQVSLIVAIALLSISLLGLSTALKFPLNLSVYLVILGVWVAFFKYARTHEIMKRSKALYKYYIRKLKGYTIIEKYNRKMKNNKIVSSMYSIEKILRNGCIDFGEMKDKNHNYGYLIACQPRKTSDEETMEQVENIQRFLNSLSNKVILKISARSQIPAINTVQEMTAKKISNKKTSKEKDLLYSIYNMSAEGARPVKWYFTIFLGVKSNEKEIEAFSNALLPGIVKILENARIPCRILTDERSILDVYANDFTALHFSKVKHKIALVNEKSIWNNLIKRLMPGRIEEKEDYVIVNNNEFISCVIVGIPRGGVSGYPSDLSPSLISQLFNISSSDENVIKLDLTVYPMDSTEAVRIIKGSMDRIDAKKATAKGRIVDQYDLQIDREDYQVLLGRLKNGEDKLYNTSFIISVFSATHEALIAGLSKVKAILSANNSMAEIPFGRVLECLRVAKLQPVIDFDLAVELPTTAVSRITPIISNSNSMTAKEGTYFGNDENEEIVINLDDMAASHMLILGSTGSGKTTGLLMMMLRDVIFQNRKVIYVTIKPDIGTNYRAAAEYFGSDAQIIDLGSKSSGEMVYNINPLEIFVDESIKGFDSESIFYRHVGIVKQFFTVLCKLDSVNQTAYLELSLMELYENFRISPYKPETWKIENPPTLKDLHKIWERDMSINVSAEALYNKTTSINYAWKFLSTPTNVDLSKKFIVIDLSGIPADLREGMNYLLTAVLSLRFNISAKIKTSIYIDEGRVFLKNPILADDIITYLTQARSYGVRLIIATQQLSDLRHVSEEFKTNTFLSLIFGNNASPSLDILTDYFKLNQSDQQYLKSCNRQGQALLLVGPPYNQSYHIFMKLSPLEEQIIFGEKEVNVSDTFTFLKPELEKFAEEQGVIFSDWVTGDTSMLKAGRTAIFQQRTAGSGKSMVFVKSDMIKDGLILNQSYDHYLAVLHLAGSLIMKGIPVKVNHFNDADIVAQFLDGMIAFEYHTAGNNGLDKMMKKRENAESKYGRVFFVGNTDSLPELKKTLQDEEIIISRGKNLEDLIDRLLEESNEKAKRL